MFPPTPSLVYCVNGWCVARGFEGRFARTETFDGKLRMRDVPPKDSTRHCSWLYSIGCTLRMRMNLHTQQKQRMEAQKGKGGQGLSATALLYDSFQ